MTCSSVLARDAVPEGYPGDVIETEQVMYYTIKEGDTLWDLSVRFYDTPALWPDLWKLNPHVENPHWIAPGTVVKLYRNEAMALEPEEEARSGPDPWGAGEPEEIHTYEGIGQVGFISEKPFESVGRIMKLLGDQKLMISRDDLMYVNFKEGTEPHVGQRFTIFRVGKRVPDPDRENGYLGFQHTMLGQAMVVEKYDSHAVARVTASYEPIRIDDRIMPYEVVDEDVVLRPGVPGIKSRILASDQRSNIFGKGTIVFLDTGSVDGVKPGQTYSIFEKREIVTWDDLELEEADVSPREVGRVLILKTMPETSTAVVTESIDILKAGMNIRNTPEDTFLAE
ncbi:MAG: LysM peptidoglycan-binding domain-containing protein [Desulfatibacillaceae bacterium]